MVTSRKRNRFSRGLVRAYLTVGSQAALALENLRLLEEAQRSGVLIERQRLAHEIHDTLAQGFTSIIMNLNAEKMARLAATTETSSRNFLEQAQRTAKESLSEARRLVWALRPESLERDSLTEALGRLAERHSEEKEATTSFSFTGTPVPLVPEVESALLRVAQEALSNAGKHARAKRIVMTLSYMEDCVTLDVYDDGVGFDSDRASDRSGDHNSGGFGLKGMRERVEQLGGTLVVESEPGEGVTLMVELPVAQAQALNRSTPIVVEERLSGRAH
jgi:signal transduction histidine kinase